MLAHAVAAELHGDLDVVLVHKLRHPAAPEVAVGAVDETGEYHVSETFRAGADLDPAYLKAEAARQLADLRARRAAYAPVHPPHEVQGRTIIVGDDGLATGATMQAALLCLRRRGPARLVAAAPIAPAETLEDLNPLADEVVCLEVPPMFSAVSQGYDRFPQVSDEDVIALLASQRVRDAGATRPDAVVFDFDGVIADTEPLHYRAFQEVLLPEGMTYSWEEYLADYVGFDDRDAFRFGFRSAGKALTDERLTALIDEKERVFEALVRGGDLDVYPGIGDLLAALRAAAIPVALCTGARSNDIRAALDALRLQDAFDAVVTADDVASSKPDPESYRRSMARLADVFPGRALRPEWCVAIEDTPAGVASAKAAGLRVLAVTTTHSAEALAKADRVAGHLEGMGVDTLSALIRA